MDKQNELTGNNEIKESRQIIGRNIKEIRSKQNLSQKDLAGMIGVSPSMIWLYENGYRAPSSNAFIRIAVALGVYGYELTAGISDYPMSMAMMDPLRYGDDEVIEFAKKIGRNIPEKEQVVGSLAYQVIADDMPFSMLLDPIGIHKAFVDDDSMELLKVYRELNPTGKAEALKRISELVQIEKYKRASDEPLTEKEKIIEELYHNMDLV